MNEQDSFEFENRSILRGLRQQVGHIIVKDVEIVERLFRGKAPDGAFAGWLADLPPQGLQPDGTVVISNSTGLAIDAMPPSERRRLVTERYPELVPCWPTLCRWFPSWADPAEKA